jgi:putative FmdB family regulatory protein
MPVYEFMCDSCGKVTERIFKIEDCPDAGGCPHCDGTARRVLSSRYAILSDTPAWLNDQVREVLQKDGEPPIETRKQHDDYLKRNGIVQRA